MLYRTNPASNYYVMGPNGFGPFAFPVSADSRAEAEFQEWLAGSLDSQMPYGPRHEGKYTLWRQPVTPDLRISHMEAHASMISDMMEDVLVAAELLPLAYSIRPGVDYSEFRFLGHIRNWHAALAPDTALGVEDVFAVSTFRADRILLFGVYGDPTDEHPEPCWSSWLSTTIPSYAPSGTSMLGDLSAIVNISIEGYGRSSFH
jgi:hypothetical protein